MTKVEVTKEFTTDKLISLVHEYVLAERHHVGIQKEFDLAELNLSKASEDLEQISGDIADMIASKSILYIYVGSRYYRVEKAGEYRASLVIQEIKVWHEQE